MKKLLALGAAAALLLPACVKVDNSLGKGLVDKSLILDTYTVEFPLENIQMKKAADLSAFSEKHLTIGAIRDDVFGLTTRSAAFPLIPALDTIDLGTNPVAVSFELYFELDTVSVALQEQARILQSIRVTELTEAIPTDNSSLSRELSHGEQLVTDGTPSFNGSGPLHFKFTKDFAQKYVDVLQALGPTLIDRAGESIDQYNAYVALLPGIHLSTDIPEGNGGRINLFDFSCLTVVNNYYQRNANVGYLTVNSSWNGVQKDSTFMFIPGETEFVDEAEYMKLNTKFQQYCYNYTTHETIEGASEDVLYVEGGGGLKPVISALELQEKTIEAILEKGGDPSRATIVKATIELPFAMPDDYLELDLFPKILSPTIRTNVKDTEGNEHLTFAGLTDASVSSENQGEIDRSNLKYAPDFTYHLQEILGREDLDTATNADIWLLTIHTEQVANASGSAAENEYLQSLMYAQYYQSLYGGYGGYGYGYGGGSYGGYGYNSYSNYYSYMMLAQMMAAQQQQTYSYTSELDRERYYKAVLSGPDTPGRYPVFRVTFAIPQD